MGIIKVGIYLDDREYGRNMAMGLSREYSRFNITVMENLDASKSFDLVLSSEMHIDDNVIFASRSKAEVIESDMPPYSIYIYNDSKSIVKDLLFIYFKLTGVVHQHRGENTCRILTFASVTGGAGTTSTAIGTGIMINRHYGLKCLYMNLCPLDNSFIYLNKVEKDLNKLAYYLEKDDLFPIETYITQGEEIDCINNKIWNCNFELFDEGIIGKLIDRLSALGQYNYLIIDIGNHFSIRNMEIINMSDLLVEVCDMRVSTIDKREKSYNEFEKMIEDANTFKVYNHGETMWDEKSDNSLSENVVISEYDEKIENDYYGHLSKGYGFEISSISKKIVEGIAIG